MKCTIFGLPFSGKSTVFSAISGQPQAPGAMPQERHAMVRVPDSRLAALEKLYAPKKTTYSMVEFIDLPGFSLQDSHGREEMARILPVLRQSDVLVMVLRRFRSEDIPKYRDRIDPIADMAELWEEMCYADLISVTNRIERIEASLKKPSGKHEQEKHELALLLPCQEALESSKSLASLPFANDINRHLSSFGFVTLKPIVAVFNVNDDEVSEPATTDIAHVSQSVNLCAQMEAEIAMLDPADRETFLADLGVKESAADRLVTACCRAAKQIAFLTAGPQEVRSWMIPENSTAVEAAGDIHSDLARGFIRAETVAYDDLMAAGDMKAAKSAGKVRQEGKGYVVQDGDILNIRFNV